MATLFVDSSAAAKRYVNEIGSTWVRNNLDPSAGNVVIVSELLRPEVQRTLSKYHLDKSIRTRAFVTLRKELLLHLDKDYLVIAVDAARIEDAARLIRKHFLIGTNRLRTLDAIHLACAIEARNVLNEPIVFVVGDGVLRDTALAEGFHVENPESYP